MKRILVVLVVLLALGVVGDFLLRAAAENAAARLIDKRVAQKGEPEVGLGDFPFVASVFRGHFERITVDIASAREKSLLVEDIHLTLENVDLEPLEVLGGEGSLRAASLRGRGVISEETLNRVITEREPSIEIDVKDGSILVSRGGVATSANAVVASNRILFAAGEVVGPLEVPLPALLPGVRFSSLRAESDRLVLGAVASKVTIRP